MVRGVTMVMFAIYHSSPQRPLRKKQLVHIHTKALLGIVLAEVADQGQSSARKGCGTAVTQSLTSKPIQVSIPLNHRC